MWIRQLTLLWGMGLLVLLGHREMLQNSSSEMAKKKRKEMDLVLSKIQVSDQGPSWPSFLYICSIFYSLYRLLSVSLIDIFSVQLFCKFVCVCEGSLETRVKGGPSDLGLKI